MKTHKEEMKTEKKKVTKHVVGPVITLIEKWQANSSYNGLIYPPVEGIIFSNKGSEGRLPLFDASKNKTGDIFAYWKDEEKGFLEISASEPGYEIKAPVDMSAFFLLFSTMSVKPYFLDVTHLDVSQTKIFNNCFWGFGMERESQLLGIEKWDVSSGESFYHMFFSCFRVNKCVDLDLTSWKFQSNKCKNFAGMFESFGLKSKETNLNLSGWNVKLSTSMSSMFQDFALEASSVTLKGVENWEVPTLNCEYNYMFFRFAPKSNCCLNLEA